MFKTVNVYDFFGFKIGEVEYTTNLDNPRTGNSGERGLHKGLEKLDKTYDYGNYALIHGTDWEGKTSKAEVINEEEALFEIIDSGNLELLDEFDLREKYDKYVEA